MSDLIEVTGMVLSAMPIGEYDRRIVILTRERGKISAFAKGARRTGNQFLGVTRAFVFGKFQLYEGRTSYNIRQVDISNYFEGIISDLDAVCYACYFAELSDYYGRENLDASQMINLLYVALKALLNPKLPKRLVRYIYELRLMALNGECPDFFTCSSCGSEDDICEYSMTDVAVYCSKCVHGTHSADAGIIGSGAGRVRMNSSTVYTLQYIITAPLEKLFTFTVSEEVLSELKLVIRRVCATVIDKHMKSEEMLID